MRFKNKKWLREELSKLSKEITLEIRKRPVSSAAFGIEDAYHIISEYLTVNEYGLALEHLHYIIEETNWSLTSEQKKRISTIENLFK